MSGWEKISLPPQITTPVPEHDVFYLVILKSTIRNYMNEEMSTSCTRSAGITRWDTIRISALILRWTKNRFLPEDEDSARQHVECRRVDAWVNHFNQVPKRGYEHAAYRIVVDGAVYLADCVSTFDRSLPRMDTFIFTHYHFPGA